MVKRQTGFTLIELLVAIGIMVTVGALASGLFFTILKQSSKTNILTEVKQNGDYAISVMERMIRNAAGVESTCSGSGNSLTINNPDGRTTTFSLGGTSNIQIASVSALGTGFLTNEKVAATGLNFTCSRTPGKPDVVSINFTLSQPGTPTRPEERASMDFQTTVSLRTY